MTMTLQQTAREEVAEGLQSTLVDLIDLALQSKQAHWNLRGPNFRPLHLQLDEIIADLRNWSDEVAERITTIDIPADGRVAEIAEKSDLSPIGGGWLQDSDVVRLMEEKLGSTAGHIRQRMVQIEETDVVSHDLLISIVHGLEKHQWMIRSQIEG